jgi:glutamate-ammonia-ligase adenylyltransferase
MVKTKMMEPPLPFDIKFGNEIKEVYGSLSNELGVLLGGIGGCSPYLYNLLIEHENWLTKRLSIKNFDIIGEITTDLDNSSDLHKTLRISKSKIALWTAICDLGGFWDLDKVMQTLTEFADLSLQRSMEFEFNNNSRFKKLVKVTKGIDNSGWFVLAMGKMGAFELNYSSDIDLIFLFDDSLYPDEMYNEIRMAFIRMSRSVNKLINETTGLGYVFRTDFRLRPNPSVTPICLSIDSALGYYESAGRAWERAAFIKARPCAGDVTAGLKFLKKLQPFIWRKHLDFAAIKDAHDIRQQIKANNLSPGANSLLGQNIKLIEGGIRDIEFFAQTKQIIAGGRDDTLRASQTVKALKDLAKRGWLKSNDLSVLTDAYKFYRTLEHRLQMVNDLQTHNLPLSKLNFKRISYFMGKNNTFELVEKINKNLLLVSKITRKFFSPEVENYEISDTFLDLSEEWLKLPTLRSDRAKEIFRSIRPIIIKKALESGNPDLILKRFSKFLEALPSGVQLFSLFASNNELIDLLLEICASGEGLSSYLARNSQVFDSVLDGDFFRQIEFDKIFPKVVKEISNNGSDYEVCLNSIRRVYSELHFRIGVQFLRGMLNSEQAAFHYSSLADHILNTVWFFCCRDFESTHGKMPQNGAILVGLGSLGARKMSANSDLDLILIYDAQNDLISNGKKPLDVPVYYSRLTKKFLTALNAKMEHGELYRVDMRLRPSGKKGPVATSFNSYKKYQINDAWIWERLAFSKARVICGHQELQVKFESLRGNILNKRLKKENVFEDISSMRRKIELNHVEFEFPWDLRRGPGNLLELELLGQGCAVCLGLKSRDTLEHLKYLEELGNWSSGERNKLLKLYLLMSHLRQALALIGSFNDLNNDEAKFVHRFVGKELGFIDMKKMKESLSNLRKYASDLINKKIEDGWMKNE